MWLRSWGVMPMANNRIVLTCDHCKNTNPGLATFQVAKYYPTTGWYDTLGERDDLQLFFDCHKHNGELVDCMFGTHIRVELEHGSAE